MRNLLIGLALIAAILSGCGRPVEVVPQAEKWEALPKERISLIADVQNLRDGIYVSKYFWAVRTPDCGDVSCVTCSSIYWTAPAEVPKSRMCSVSVEATLRASGDSYYEDRVTTIFDIKVNPYPVKNLSPVVTLHVPLQFVSLDETISLWVEASDPEGGLLTYRWWATCGKVEGGGGTGISWTAPPKVPAGGKCTIHVSVEDQERAATGASAEFVIN